VTSRDVSDRVASVASQEGPATIEPPAVHVIPYRGMRKVIGDRLHDSSVTTAPVTLVSEFNVESMVELRNQLLPYIEKKTGVRLTYTDILIKIVGHAVADYPRINASLTEQGIIIHPHINVGMAVSLPDGLLVPVIREPHKRPLREIAVETKELAEKARSGRISPDELKGGTITVSNLGQYGVDFFSPIINLPETAIVGVGRIKDKPVVIDRQVTIKPVMTVSVVFDHRIIDGAQGAEFLNIIGKYIQQCSLILA